MLRLRLRIESQPRAKNGQPPHSTTGVANASSVQATAACGNKIIGFEAGQSSASMGQSSGTVRSALNQKRRRMLASSWSSPAVAVGVSGSNAIPQIGHVPGLSARISVCIGHVHIARRASDAGAGSRGAWHECVVISCHLSTRAAALYKRPCFGRGYSPARGVLALASHAVSSLICALSSLCPKGGITPVRPREMDSRTAAVEPP